jgi:hypothetical protein
MRIRPGSWKVVGVGIGVAAAVAATAAWLLTRPRRLGLERPRVVLVAGEAWVDEARAKAAQPFAAGATVHTGRGSTCFSLHASRACLGAGGEVRLAELGTTSAALEHKRGALVLAAAGDELRVKLASGSVTVRDGIVAVELEGPAVVRAIEGSAEVEVGGRPAVVVATPDALSLMDGRKRPPAAALEREERDVARLARRWQGSAGSVLEVDQVHGRVEVDGADVGLTPAGVLLDEGSHTLVVRDGVREVTRETIELRAGQKLVRGG